jgi:F-type H+-transporting ATPase subunit b
VELSLTTFVFEIINFLVLLWILKRLFFAPIQRAIEKRKVTVTKTLEDAQEMKRDAEKLQAQYEGRMKEWEEEKSRARQELQKSLAEEQSRRLKEMEASVQSAQAKIQAQIEKDAADFRERAEHEAMKYALKFVSRLLSGFASPELETQIISLTLEHIRRDDQILAAPKEIAEPQNQMILVRTAFTLPETEKKAFLSLVKPVTGEQPPIEFSTDPKLVAGMEITHGSMVLRANLRDELAYFSEVTHS